MLITPCIWYSPLPGTLPLSLSGTRFSGLPSKCFSSCVTEGRPWYNAQKPMIQLPGCQTARPNPLPPDTSPGLCKKQRQRRSNTRSLRHWSSSRPPDRAPSSVWFPRLLMERATAPEDMCLLSLLSAGWGLKPPFCLLQTLFLDFSFGFGEQTRPRCWRHRTITRWCWEQSFGARRPAAPWVLHTQTCDQLEKRQGCVAAPLGHFTAAPHPWPIQSSYTFKSTPRTLELTFSLKII